jgi:hypothetical protein
MSVRLDRALGRAQRKCDLFVYLSSNDRVVNLPLTQRQSSDAIQKEIKLALALSRYLMPEYCAPDCLKKEVGWDRFDQKILGADPDRLHDSSGVKRTPLEASSRFRADELAVPVRQVPVF